MSSENDHSLDSVADDTSCHHLIPRSTDRYVHTLLDPENCKDLAAITPFNGQSATLIRLTTISNFNVESGQQLNVVALPNVQQHLWAQTSPSNEFRGGASWVDQAWERPSNPSRGFTLSLSTPVAQDPSYASYEVPEFMLGSGTFATGEVFVPMVSPSTDYGRPGFKSYTPTEADLVAYPVLEDGPLLAVRISNQGFTMSFSGYAAVGNVDVRVYYLDSAGALMVTAPTTFPATNPVYNTGLAGVVDQEFIVGYSITYTGAGTLDLHRFQISGTASYSPASDGRIYAWSSRAAGSANETRSLDDNFTNYFPVAMSLRVTWASGVLSGGRVFAARNQYRDDVFIARNASLIDESSLGVQSQHFSGNAHQGSNAVWTPATTQDFEFRPWRSTYQGDQSNLAAQMSVDSVAPTTIGVVVTSSIVIAIQSPSQIWTPSHIEGARGDDLEIVMDILRKRQLVTENPLHLRHLAKIMREIKRAVVNNYHYVRPIAKAAIALAPGPVSVPLTFAESAFNDYLDHEAAAAKRAASRPKLKVKDFQMLPRPVKAKPLPQREQPTRRRLRRAT